MTQNSSLDSAEATEESCIRCSGLHNHATQTQLRWFEMSRTAEGKKSNQQSLTYLGAPVRPLEKLSR